MAFPVGVEIGRLAPNRRRQGLVDQVGGPGAGLHRRLHHRPPFDTGDAGGNADHDFRLEDALAAADLGDEVVEHALGDDEVGNHSLAHRPDGVDGAWRATQHLRGLGAYGEDPVALLIDRHHAGLIEDNPLALDIDQHGGRAEVDSDLLGKQSLLREGAGGPAQRLNHD